MKLSAPIHVLKNQAKNLKKEESISMVEALNEIAKREGYSSWSLLQSKQSHIYPTRYDEILSFFNEGDLVLIGARPGQGKTSFTIGLFVQAIQEMKRKNYYFSLAEVHRDVADRMAIYDKELGETNKFFELNYSDDICADYIIDQTKKAIGKRSLIIIDYLQLLDEKRVNDPLQAQLEQLKVYAKEKGCIIIFISQLDREIEYRIDRRPGVDDIRLPNPLDTNLLNKVILLHHDNNNTKKVEASFVGKFSHRLSVRWDQSKIKFY